MHHALAGSVRRSVLRRSLCVNGASSSAAHGEPTALRHSPYRRDFNALLTAHIGRATASFSSASDHPRPTAGFSASLRSDILALEHLHSLLSSRESPLSQQFDAVLTRLQRCHQEKRCIFVTGIGKSGIVARRLAATLASISIRSQWVHGSEWVHGELGNLQSGDVVIMMSHSGSTSELLSLPSAVEERGCDSVAIVGQHACALAERCSLPLEVPAIDRVGCPVPSRSIIVQEAITNAIVECFVDASHHRADAFRANHPGGAIGDRLQPPHRGDH